jgi:dienelactone hydrolase
MDATATIETTEITCRGGMPAYLCLPAGAGKAPVAIMMHERAGPGNLHRTISGVSA